MKALKLRSLIAMLLAPIAGAAAAHTPDLTDLDLHTLMDMDVNVTSVAKKSTRVIDSPAAVTVITQDDMRRLGITRVPEALRMVPGLDVGRISANTWAISSRGFNEQYANKLLVLIDGRTVYTPSFGGVFWDVQDLMIEDIDRIEVIRGPGATLWGANAVNGVINITTKNARDTRGGLLASVAGSEEQPAVSVRYGGELGDAVHYRTYAKYVNADGLVQSDGRSAPDISDSLRGGFRADWDRSPTDTLTLQGDGYSGHEGESVYVPQLTPPFAEVRNATGVQNGANLLGRWTRKVSDAAEMSLQTYVDHSRHEGARTIEARDTFDIQWEQRLPLGARHDVNWGLGYRFTKDDFNQTEAVFWDLAHADLNLYTVFVQDEVALVPGSLSLTFGSKLEHNDYTGFEVQPSARVRWTPHERHIFWASLSHAVSTPTRLNRNGRVNVGAFQPSPSAPVFEALLFGSPDVGSERLNAFELGYRFEAAANLSLDIATFYNRYRDVTQAAPAGTEFVLTPIPHVVVKEVWANDVAGHTYGAEASVQWQPLDLWRMTATYSYIAMRMDDTFYDDGTPQQQVSVRSYLNLPRHLELNTALYYVDRIKTPFGAVFIETPGYVRFDTGVTWHPGESLELGLWGQNLLDARHRENTSFNTTLLTEVPRTVVGRVTWRF